MNTKNKQEILLIFIREQHSQQTRKYTGEAYLNHLIAVAEMAEMDKRVSLGYEIGLCHDLLEDTSCSPEDLYLSLMGIGYSAEEAGFILGRVNELTDFYTKERFPNLNRVARKNLEAFRLYSVSYEAQTVKYCDIINNSESILQNDPEFAKVYIPELKTILAGMKNGNKDFYKSALHSLIIEPSEMPFNTNLNL